MKFETTLHMLLIFRCTTVVHFKQCGDTIYLSQCVARNLVVSYLLALYRPSSMWGRVFLLWIFIWAVDTAPKITICPEKCKCSMLEEGLKAQCSSIEFLSKLMPKQIQQIIELDLSDTSLKKIDNKLKKLRNLKRLDLSKNQIKLVEKFPDLPQLTHLYLSQNRIENFTAIDLPKSITNLDLSSNKIRNITDLTKNLPKLAEVNINSNPLSCECDFLKYRDLLLLNDVFIVRPINCNTPEYVKNISMLSVYCASGKVTYDDWEQMLRDDPGSGEYSAISRTSLDVVDFDKFEENETAFDKIEGEYFQTKIDSTSTETEEDSFEGSGSSLFDVMGSGDGNIIPIAPDPNVSHCYYNCSTPTPIDDANKSAPSANIGQEITKFFSELAGKKEESTTSTTPSPIVEIQISKTMLQETGSDKSRASVEPPKDFPTTESAKKDNTTTYIVVAVLFAAMVVLIAYVIVKKRTRRNNRPPIANSEVKEPPQVEMKPLLSDKPVAAKPVTVPEMTPLMNGQNGTKKDNEAESEDIVDSKASPLENGIDIPEEETQLRPKKDDEVTDPGTKRVTIQAKELSSPKSPVLVHRHVGDDGKIIISSPISKTEKYT